MLLLIVFILFVEAWQGDTIKCYSEYIKSVRAQMYTARMRRLKQQQKQKLVPKV